MEKRITVRGLCPRPTIEKMKAIRGMKEGDVLRVEFECEEFIEESKAWSKRNGHKMEVSKDDDRGLFVIHFTLGGASQ